MAVFGCILSLMPRLITDVSDSKMCAAECHAESHIELNGRRVLGQFPLCLQTHCHSVGWCWIDAEVVPPQHCDHSFSTSTPQQSHIKFSLRLFPESIISFTLFIFHTPWLQYEAVPDTHSGGCFETLSSSFSIFQCQIFNYFSHLMWATAPICVFIYNWMFLFFGGGVFFRFLILRAFCGHCHTAHVANL